MITHKALGALVFAAALTACGLFDETAVRDLTAPLPAARVKFFNFGVSSPGVNFYANDEKITAIGSTLCTPMPTVDSLRQKCEAAGRESTLGVAYGSAGSSGLYLGIEPGQYTFTGRIAATTDNNLPISTVTQTVENGKLYSFYQSGIYNSTAKTVDAFIIEDAVPSAVDVAKAHVRFVHAISNANPMTLFITNATTSTQTAVGSSTAYKGGTAFIEIAPGAYNLATRYDGVATNALTRANVTFAGGRVYTVAARGSITTAATLFLDNTANR